MSDRPRTLQQIREKIEAGDYGPIAFDRYIELTETQFRLVIAAGMDIQPARIVRCKIVDVDAILPGKFGIDLHFEPELSADEREQLRRLVTTVAHLLGGRTPIFPGDA